MVDENLTDEQQAELVKNWWKENGVYLIAGLAIGVGGLFGWPSYKSSQLATAQEASVAYEEMVTSSAQQRYNKSQEMHDVIVSDYAGTPYADTAELSLAATFMEQNDPEQAAEVLRRVIDNSGDPEIVNIATVRLGRVLLQMEDYDAAAAVAVYGKDDSYTSVFADLRGDIAFARGDMDAARTEYELALASAGPSFPQAGYVQVKLDDLPAQTVLADSVAEEAVSE